MKGRAALVMIRRKKLLGRKGAKRPLEGNPFKGVSVQEGLLDLKRATRLNWPCMRGHPEAALLKKALLAGLGLLFCAASLPTAPEDPIKVEASILPLRVARGEEGRVILKIRVKEGFTVNSLPSFIIEFGPGTDLLFPKNFFTASDLNLEVVEENGKQRLNLKKPVEIGFTVSPKATRGIFILQGRVKYFATSDKDGWCLKSSTKFTARTLIFAKIL